MHFLRNINDRKLIKTSNRVISFFSVYQNSGIVTALAGTKLRACCVAQFDRQRLWRTPTFPHLAHITQPCSWRQMVIWGEEDFERERAGGREGGWLVNNLSAAVVSPASALTRAPVFWAMLMEIKARLIWPFPVQREQHQWERREWAHKTLLELH